MMKIVHIVPGSGGSFYCENCLRDEALVRHLRGEGHDVVMVPLYLPLSVEEPSAAAVSGAPVFYGAINVYLSQLFPWYGRVPRFMTRWLDSLPILRWAARRAGSTRADGLEEMTLSMLRGPAGRQARELGDLVAWLDSEGHPDIVHLSNALLLGLAEPLKHALGAKVFCTLQDEDSWVDSMPDAYARRTWSLMSEKARGVDCFIAVSEYYAHRMSELMDLPGDTTRVIYPGLELSGRRPASSPPEPRVVGYFSRLSEALGLGIAAEAFLALKRRPGFGDIRFRASGGLTSDDRPFVEGLRRRFAREGVAGDVDLQDTFDPLERLDFLRSLSVLSVPVLSGEAFGMFIIEALSVGVPVIQPRVGAFPEVIEKSGGGVVYEPNTAEALCDALAEVLGDPDRLADMGKTGRANVMEQFDMRKTAAEVLLAYSEVLDADT